MGCYNDNKKIRKPFQAVELMRSFKMFFRLRLYLVFAAISLITTNTSTYAQQQTQSYEQIIRSANEKFIEKDYISAKTYYEMALRIKEKDSFAEKRLAETIALIQKQLVEQELFYGHLDAGDRLFRQGKQNEALEAYKMALAVFPNDRYVNSQVNTITEQMAKVQKRQSDYEQAMRLGEQLATASRFEEALVQYNLATELFPENKEPKEKITAVQALLKEQKAKEQQFQLLRTEANNQLQRRNYNEAILRLEEALKLFPDDAAVKTQLFETRLLSTKAASYQQALQLADQAYEAKNTEEARKLYAQAQALWPDQTYPADMIRRIDEMLNSEAYQREVMLKQYLSEANKGYDNGELENALSQYNKVLEIDAEHTLAGNRVNEIVFKLNQLKSEKENLFRFETAFNQASELLRTKNYAEAITAFDQALSFQPDHDESKRLKTEAQSALDTANAAQNKAEQYNRLITEADKLFAEGTLETARKRYSEAQITDPAQTHPTQQIELIDARLKQLADTQKIDNQYNQLITEADLLFKQENWQAAKNTYTNALSLKANESYPKTQIESIDNKLAIFAKEESTNRAYDAAIATADENFSKQELDKARSAYNEALALKPDAQYPKNQLIAIDALRKELDTARERESRINELTAKADGLLRTNQSIEAIAVYDQILALDPTNTNAAARKAEISLALEAASRENQRKYQEAIAEGDRLAGINEYQQAVTAYKSALGFNKNDTYASSQISRIEAILLERITALRNEYNRAKNEADRHFNNKSFDQAIESYLKAENIKPDEAYPREMIRKIAAIFEANKIRELNTGAVTIVANVNKRFTFEPVDVAERRSNYILIKAKNTGTNSFPLLVNFGSKSGRNGGFVLPIPENQEYNDFIVRIGAQYRWFSEDNTWIELLPENGSIEVTTIQISKEN